MAVDLNILSLALLGAAAMAFTRQRTAVLVACGGLFMPVAACATLAVYWAAAPWIAVVLLALGLGLPGLGLLLFGVDRLWAPFCLEMTYASILCWIAWPALVGANFIGLILL